MKKSIKKSTTKIWEVNLNISIKIKALRLSWEFLINKKCFNSKEMTPTNRILDFSTMEGTD